MIERRKRRQRGVFIDSSAFCAVINDRDQNHGIASAIARRLAAERLPLLTTNYVLVETHALLLARVNHRAATLFLREADNPSFTIERAEADDERAARAIIYRYEDKAFSLVDAISFAMMERLGITVAFTFDRNFAQYGFEVMRA